MPVTSRLCRVLLAVLLLGPCFGGAAHAREKLVATRFAVTSGHPAASAAGLSVLQQGGNVVDAAVTTSLAMGVAAPWGSGLGGKMVMLYRNGATGEVHCVEALNAAPRELDPDKFAALPREDRRHGFAAVCVPGLPAGLALAHGRWGSRDWDEVVQPAVELAERGIPFDQEMQPLFRHKVARLRHDPGAAGLYLSNGKAPGVGSSMQFPDLAATLREIAAEGVQAFYKGEIGKRIVEACRAGGSDLTQRDFATYEPRVPPPLTDSFGGYRVCTSPPPTTGGVTVLAALKTLEGVDWTKEDTHDIHSIEKLCGVLLEIYPRIDKEIADVVDSVEMAKGLLAPESIRLIRRNALAIAEDAAARDKKSQPVPQPLEPTLDDESDASTSHLVVADSEGNVVCITQSLSFHFGASVVAPGTGVLLNNSMSNFNVTNRKSVNTLAPGKRPRSTVAPVIVEEEGHVKLALGIPGGQRIPSTTIQLLLDVLGSGQELPSALGRWRYHLRRPIYRGEPSNFIDFEEEAPDDLVGQLVTRGWRTEERQSDGSYFGGGNGVQYLPDGRLLAAADPRRTNDAAGK